MTNEQTTLSTADDYDKRVKNKQVSSSPVDMKDKTEKEVNAFLLAEHKQWTVVENLQIII